MSFRGTLTRLFRSLTFTRRAASALSTVDTVRDEIQRRIRVRKHTAIEFACKGNQLSPRDVTRLIALYEDIEALKGRTDALFIVRNTAATMSLRRTRLQRPSDPWEPTPPAAA